MDQDSMKKDSTLDKIIKSVAQLNPHFSLSDVAFLMDVPYEPEPLEQIKLNKPRFVSASRY